jgi:proteasome activator subunit 4
MALPDIGSLYINSVPVSSQQCDTITPPGIPEPNGINKEVEKLKNLARLLPYSIEPDSRMQQILDFIIKRICQAVEAQDYDVGFLQWDTMLALFVNFLLLFSGGTC